MSLVDPSDSLERQNAKLARIVETLMHKVEQGNQSSSLAYAQFERAALLEAQVKKRTIDLERTLGLLHDANTRLGAAKAEAEAARSNLAEAVESINEGFALFDAGDRLVMSNSRFCRELADILPRVRPGLAFRDYVMLVSQSVYLDLPEGETPAQWREKRMRRHSDDRVTFNVRLTGERWLQVGEHRTQSGGTVILQTDVSEIMRAERDKRDRLMDRQAQMVRATLDHLNQGVCIFDTDRRLVGWNQQMEALLSPRLSGDLVGIGFDRLLDRLDGTIAFTPFFGRDHLLVWSERQHSRQPLNFELRYGPERTLSVYAQEMPDHGFVISFTDVTGERAAAGALREINETLERRVRERTIELGDALEEARRANASKTRFVAAASHDLLQPLSAAKLFVSFLEDRADDALARETAAKAVSALASVEDIIEALLDISKLDSGRVEVALQEVRLGDILASLRSEMTHAAEAKGLKLRILPSSHVVNSDPVYLRRILQNLVSNAIRYTETGRILVGARRSGADTRIEVCDTGPGIAEADRETIFQEFKQLGPSLSGAKGLGLGLTIVERACASLNHGLALRSEPGRGSCFSVTAERLSVIPKGSPAQSVSAGEARPGCDNLVVLLVENDPEVAGALTLMIEEWGSHVIHAESGEDALSLMDEIDISPDRLLLDYRLGSGMTGTELLEKLRARYGHAPARIISASRRPDILDACEALGVELVPKPLDRLRLIALLDETTPEDAAPA